MCGRGQNTGRWMARQGGGEGGGWRREGEEGHMQGSSLVVSMQ